ncbi:hypothetical protein Anas_13312 [Armadillidium nasatum]|uniref:C-type lectin domain-containing protein n=1 Tax=Armadillidium nasatum TaxID=96803 RepID=A0A5N5T2V2_9CRUS|nr:hypothetical protein Anas_13312 [Armadillidium nasatum]
MSEEAFFKKYSEEVIEIVEPNLSLKSCIEKELELQNPQVLCLVENACKYFRVDPCEFFFVPEGVSDSDDFMTCSTNLEYKILNYIFEKVAPLGLLGHTKFYDQVGCVWKSSNYAKWNEVQKNCAQKGGQLISFENYESEEEMKTFVSTSGYYSFIFIGIFRKGKGNNFQWLTGSNLELTSPLWYSGEPNDKELEDICGMIYKEKVADEDCNTKAYGICHVPFPKKEKTSIDL